MIIMSMGQDYVSERRPPTGLLFIPEVTHKHVKRRWIDIYKKKLLIRPPELRQFYQNSRLLAKQEDTEKEMINFAYDFSLSYS
jgi:hypothetical protein